MVPLCAESLPKWRVCDPDISYSPLIMLPITKGKPISNQHVGFRFKGSGHSYADIFMMGGGPFQVSADDEEV